MFDITGYSSFVPTYINKNSPIGPYLYTVHVYITVRGLKSGLTTPAPSGYF